MRVAVVGGGIFGTTAAIHAARAGHTVHLVEAATRLLSAASWVNQYRLHRGYHYPRSPETAQSCSAEQASFAEDYAEAIVTDVRHLYGVARQGSLVSAAQFVAFCRDQSLPLRPATSPELINPVLADTFEASEASIDPDILLRLVPQRLAESGVQVHLGVRAGAPTLDAFDKIIVAAYAGNGEVLKALGHAPQTYQFEVCEKPVVNLPPQFGATDIVILDGPFMSVGPMGRTGAYVLGHVTHAIHATNVGAEADVPAALRDCLDQGTIRNPKLTNFSKFIAAGAPFIPALADAVHIGSMYTVRAVLPDREDTDERPTLVTRVGDRLITIFSGKIVNCVAAARAAVALI